MAAPPTLHTFDPLIEGMVGLRVDPPPANVSQVVYYAATTTGGPYTEMAVVLIRAGLDGLQLILDADVTPRFWVAKVYDGSYSGWSNEVATAASAGPPAPPPPPTRLQELEDALGVTLQTGDQVAVYLQPASQVLTVQADDSLA